MFRLVKILNARINQAEPVMLATTASESYTLGEALTLSDGALTKCAATKKPLFVAARDYAAPAEEPAKIPACPVSADMIFECPVSASPASLKAGDRVTLSADALGVTATTVNGVATVWDTVDATEAGDRILVRIE
jgi:hypothetical protein